MGDTIQKRISALLLSNRKHARYVAVLACMAVAVILGVTAVLRQQGQAKTYEVKVLQCSYSGNGAHTHDASCYDADGNLVCTLQEKALHTHDDSCYASETYLICGMEEGEGAHWHSDECYDEEGNLICELEEWEGHVHTDECWQTDTWLDCDLEEVTEEHVHGEGCFTTVVVTEPDPEPDPEPETSAAPEASGSDSDDNKGAAADNSTESTPGAGATSDNNTPAKNDSGTKMPAQELHGELKAIDEDGNEYVKVAVNVKAPEGALPENTTVRVKAVNEKTIADKVDEAVKARNGEDAVVKAIYAVDITFVDAAGNEIEPAKKVEVKITSEDVKSIENPVLVHVDKDDDKDAEIVNGAAKVNFDDNDTSTGNENTVKFSADKFSPYAITDVELGEDYEELLEQMPAQIFTGETENVSVTVEAPAGAFPEGTTMTVEAIAADDVIEQVEAAVQQQDAVVRVKQAVAVDIKFWDAEGNEVEPLFPVTVRMASQAVREIEEPVLVHVPAEADAEVLGDVTMANSASEGMVGDEDTLVFEADQFSPYVIVELETLTGGVVTASGETLNVTVTYGAEAMVPEGSSLEIREILPEDEDYATYYDATSVALEGQGISSISIVDITIVGPDGEKVQPAAPVQVNVAYANPIEVGEEPQVKVVHFGDEVEALEAEEPEAEVLEAAAATTEDGAIESVSFEATSFSVYTITSTTQSSENLNGMQVAIVNQFNGTAVKGTNLAGSNNTRLTKIGVTFTDNNSVVHTTSANDITIWTFTSAGGNNTYYIQNESGQYLNIASGYVRVSDEAQAITVNPGSGQGRNNRFRLVGSGGYALNDFDNGSLASGYGPYNDSGDNEWFRLYTLDQIDAIRVHYVTADGTEVASTKLIGETTKVDGATNYTDTYAFGEVYDLYQKIDGYAYQSTHLSTISGTQINSEVIYSTADSYNIPNGTSNYDRLVQNAHYAWMYQSPEPDTTHGSVTEYDIHEFGNVRDVWVVYAAGEETIPSHGGSGSGGSDEDLDAPKPTKTLTPNGDGTYKMSLSVNASSKPIDKTHGANVILIYDESASMGTSIGGGRTRMEAARSAAKGIVEDLLKLNAGRAQGDELVEMMIISFSPDVNDVSSWATDYTVLNNWIDSNLAVDGRGGTNWEAAIKRAYTEAQRHTDGDSTYIIFMTDGNPWRPNQQNDRDAHILNYMEKGSYIYATESARRIVKAGYEIYGIGIYGNVDVLHSLMNFAYNGRSTYDPTTNAYGHYYIAQQQDQLVEALSDIAGTIAGNLSMAGVEFRDGIAISTQTKPDTTKTALETKTVSVGGVDVPVLSAVSYEKGKGAASGSESFVVTVDHDGNASISIDGGASQPVSIVSKSYDRINEDASGTTPATAYVYQYTSGGKTYEMAIATLGADGELDWDLSPLGTLENGSTYTISTTVWPDQEAYDLVTDLNNGTATWDESAATAVPPTGPVQFWQGGASRNGVTYEHIVKYPNGTYAALSNTHQSLDYYVVDQEGDETTYRKPDTITMPFPDPMGLEDEQIDLVKEFEKDMMPGASQPEKVTVDLLREGTVFISGIELIQPDYKTSKYIAPGLMINKASADAKGLTSDTNQVTYVDKTGTSSTYVVLNTGHNYQFREHKNPYGTNFELEEKIYHPMLVDDELVNIEISGTTYTQTDDDLDQGLVATNLLKGGINIDKVVLDITGKEIKDSEEVFDLDVTLKVPVKEDGSLDFTHVEDEYAEDPDTGEYIIVDGEYVIATPSVAWYRYYDADGNVVRGDDLAFAGETNHKYGTWFMLDFNDTTGIATGTVKITPKYTLRFTNMASGTTYSADETVIPIGYEDPETIRYWHQAYIDGQAQEPTDDQGDVHMVYVNTANNITVTNKQVSSDLILIKTDENGNPITSATDTAKFKLTRNEAYTGESDNWINAVDKNGLVVNGVVTVNSTDGVKLETLADGVYKISETAAPNGYVVLVKEAYFKLYGGTVQFVTWEKGTDPDSGETTYTITNIDPPAGYTVVGKTTTVPVTVKVANTPGNSLPRTGGPGTTLFTIVGSAVCVAAVVMYGFASRRGRERRFD